MDGRFRDFSFVDRITRHDGMRIEGLYTVPAHASRFPASLMAEAVGQLAAWASMSQLDFVWRPVAGLAAQTRYHRLPRPGDVLRLEATLERNDAEAVAYSGRASIAGTLALELDDAVGPMLPMAEFDDAEALRADFHTLRAGVPAGRFGGVPLAQIGERVHHGAQRLSAALTVPDQAPYFADHFPRRPVFPGTLLMDAMAQLAVELARRAEPLRGAAALAPTLVSSVKIRSFTEPGTVLQIEAELIEADARRARLKLAARNDGKPVASARVDVAVMETS